MKYLLNTSFHHKEMLRCITSIVTITETKDDWSSGYFDILYCLKTELKCKSNYYMFNFRRDKHNKLNDQSFISMLKLPLINLSKVDNKFYKKCLTKIGLKILKEYLYVKWMGKRRYLIQLYKFDDKVSSTAC